MTKTTIRAITDDTQIKAVAGRILKIILTAKGATAGDQVIFRDGTGPTAAAKFRGVVEAANGTWKLYDATDHNSHDKGMPFATGIWYSVVAVTAPTVANPLFECYVEYE